MAKNDSIVIVLGKGMEERRMKSKKNKNLVTQIFNAQIANCEDEREFKAIYDKNKIQFGSWESFLQPYVKRSGYTKKKIAYFCGVNEKTGRDLLKNIPAKRENVIVLGIVLAMSHEEIDYMLMHEARFHKLYPKNCKDAIWIYIIEHNVWDGKEPVKILYYEYKIRFDKLYEAYVQGKVQEDSFETRIVLMKLKNQEDFDSTMREIIPSVVDGYSKLIRFIEQQMEKNGNSISEFDFQNDKEKISQIYYREIRNIKNKQKIPTRIFLISLGIHMNLPVDKINELLDYAGMMPLYSKDVLESRLIFYLESLYINNPSYFAVSDEMVGLLEDEDRVQEDDLAQYIYNRLEEEYIEVGEEKILEKILGLL